MDNHLREILLDSVPVFTGKIINLRVDSVQLPDGKKAIREVVEHPGAVAVVPILADGRIILVKQYRHPVGETTWEIPAGKLDTKEAPDLCAYRELEEETGYQAKKIRKLATFFTTPGFTDEVMHLYVAEDLRKTAQKTDDDEFIDVLSIARADALAMIQSGDIKDAKSIIGILMAGDIR